MKTYPRMDRPPADRGLAWRWKKGAPVSKVAVLIKITTKPGQRAELRKLWDTHLSARVEDSPAQELYLVVEDAADPDALHLVEVYADPAQMARNAEAPWFADYLR